ncbi:DMT family transporter [Thermanaeromonas sp. C210]|uniref:DMT family transporter n=1 Tax=Thermanaeromonas sp. C210 TaxID=2731925 RepID=UPI0020B680E5|nr:DMT family transporter [Thermanaeromonas sp. C210]
MVRVGKELVAALGLLSVAAVWGATFYFVREALQDILPFHFLFYRFMAAWISLLPWARKARLFRNRRALLHGCAAGLFLFGGYAFQTVGLQYTSASKAAFITGLSVVMVPLMEAAIKRKAPPIRIVVATTLAAAGLGLLSLEGSLALSYGDWLVFLCALCFAGHVVFIDRVTRLHGSTELALIQLVTVSLLSASFLPWEPSRVVWSARVVEALVVTAVLATSAAYLIQVRAQRYLSASATAVILATEPVFGAVIACLFGGEILGPRQILGCALILVGMVGVQERRPRPREFTGGTHRDYP